MTIRSLRSIEYGSGSGFCYDIDRSLFRGEAADGPLVVALDYNIVQDTMDHGSSLISNEAYRGSVGPAYAEQLDAWAEIIELWNIRDIRFIALPGMRRDQRKPLSLDRTAKKDRALRGFEDSLTFQMSDWAEEDRRFANPAYVDGKTSTAVREVLSVLDAKLVLEAAAHGVDVFLTRDDKIVNRMGAAGLGDLPKAMRPTQLLAKLEKLGLVGQSAGPMGMFLGGHVEHEGCAYGGGAPLGDTGKWGPLFEAIERSEAQ